MSKRKPQTTITVPTHLLADVIRIEDDLRDFDGDRRGHVYALSEANEALLEAVLQSARSALSSENASATQEDGRHE
jgi:hypothetical protein